MIRLKNERGFAMIETVFATMILGILAATIIPQAARALDETYVDQEIRGLHSAMHYTQSSARLTSYKSFGLGAPTGYANKSVEFMFVKVNNGSDDDRYSVRGLVNNQTPVQLKEYRRLERGFAINSALSNRIRFTFDGNLSAVANGDIKIVKGDILRRLVLIQSGRARIER